MPRLASGREGRNVNGFPWHDWRFYVSSLLVLAGGGVARAGDARRASGQRPRQRTPRTRVRLTISAQGARARDFHLKKPGGGARSATSVPGLQVATSRRAFRTCRPRARADPSAAAMRQEQFGPTARGSLQHAQAAPRPGVGVDQAQQGRRRARPPRRLRRPDQREFRNPGPSRRAECSRSTATTPASRQPTISGPIGAHWRKRDGRTAGATALDAGSQLPGPRRSPSPAPPAPRSRVGFDRPRDPKPRRKRGADSVLRRLRRCRRRSRDGVHRGHGVAVRFHTIFGEHARGEQQAGPSLPTNRSPGGRWSG